MDRSVRSSVVTTSLPVPESTQESPSPVRMMSSPSPVKTTAFLVKGVGLASSTGAEPPVKLTVRAPV